MKTINPLPVTINFELESSILVNMIIVLLFQRSDKFVFNRESILLNIESLVKAFGVLHYANNSEAIKEYQTRDDFEEKHRKAISLIYRYLPELPNDENSIKFIKG